MLRASVRFWIPLVLSAGCVAVASLCWGAPPRPLAAVAGTPFPAVNRAGVTSDQAVRSLVGVAGPSDETLAVNGERSRGPAAKVYPKAAPAVVLVQTSTGHGTGFLIDKEGWILTNHHVIDQARVELKTGLQYVKVHFGRFEDGLMTLDDMPCTAVVYATDATKDLALLKLLTFPLGRELTAIPLAEEKGLPGTDCVAIGHPTRGALWTVRSGEIAGVATWPSESVDLLMQSILLTGTEKDQFARKLMAASKRKIVLSTCGVNPGDSGGPLLNAEGELIAVTFAIPSGGADRGVSYDKFSYHVDLTEVKTFLARRPSKAQPQVPVEWPASQVSAFADHDENGRFERWQFAVVDGKDENDKPRYKTVAVMLDLDENSPSDIKAQFDSDESKKRLFDFEFVIHLGAVTRAFYDTDDDGAIDLILIDVNRDDISDLTLERDGEEWLAVERQGQKIVDGSLFQKPAIGDMLEKRLFGTASNSAAPGN